MENDINATLPANPFNPGSPVDPNDFVGRVQEIEGFRQKLRQTEGGSLASMAIAGGYGIGKTSFLHKCKVIAEEDNALAIYFSLNELDELNRETLSKILIERLNEKVNEEVILQRISSTLIQTLKQIKVRIGESVELGIGEQNKASTNLHSALSIAWKALQPYKKAIVFLINHNDETICLIIHAIE